MKSRARVAGSKAGRIWLAAFLGCGASFAHAQTAFDWAFDLGAEHTDNVSRSATDEESETVGVAGVAFSFMADRPRFDADISANLEFRDYLDDRYESELVGGLAGLVAYAVVPDRLVWNVADNYGQIVSDRRLPGTPENREDINYFTTGPDLLLPLGARNLLRVSGRWSDLYYEDRPDTSESITGSLALIRRVSDRTEMSLNASLTATDYDEAVFVDHEIRQFYLRTELTGMRTELHMDAGYTILERDGSDESHDGLLARIALTRRIGARSSLRLDAGTEFSTTADSLRRDQSVIGVNPEAEAVLGSAEAFQVDYGYLTWTTDWERSSIVAGVSLRREEHELLPALDREQRDGFLTWRRQLTRTLDMDIGARYLDEEFTGTGFQFEEWSVRTGFGWDINRQFSLRVEFTHFDGSGGEGLRDYEENRAYIGLRYRRVRGGG
ncbi:MAG TPA: outer membrane beta-barrel protein [Steroidobacter sp.]|jgi:hypothetical protein|nr:outer membrane beta-barrel protein [Steroidobacteraceae bacterium]HLS82406.1 outer membrane beta-barrel protein [Steroidobacter sp.]